MNALCCSLAQDIRCLCHFSLERISSSDLGGQGGRETGKRPVTLLLSAPHPNVGTEGLSVTQPEASPRPGTVWPLSLGQGAIWGCPRATGARGRGNWASRDAGLARLGGVGGEQAPSGTVGIDPPRSRPHNEAFPPAPLPGEPKVLSLPPVISRAHPTSPELPAGVRAAGGTGEGGARPEEADTCPEATPSCARGVRLELRGTAAGSTIPSACWPVEDAEAPRRH